MMSAPIPFDESERLQRLHDLNVLDTAEDQQLDALTARALRAFPGATFAMISLIDKDRQWFKSVIGLDIRETSRDLAFCSHTILSSRAMVVSDATKDRRFAKNPLVTGPPHLRFYAGMPLVGGVGTLCVSGTEPRAVTQTEMASLTSLATLVGTQLLMFGALNALAGAPVSTFGLVGKDIRNLIAEPV